MLAAARLRQSEQIALKAGDYDRDRFSMLGPLSPSIACEIRECCRYVLAWARDLLTTRRSKSFWRALHEFYFIATPI